MTVAPMSSNSLVVTPGRTACFMDSSLRRTIAPAARIFSSSSGVLIDTVPPLLAYLIREGTRAEKQNEGVTSDIERKCLADHKAQSIQHEPQQRDRFA